MAFNKYIIENEYNIMAMPIPTITNLRARQHRPRKYLGNQRNNNNLIKIQITESTNPPNRAAKFAYVPSFLLSNVMSLSPKIDEVREVIRSENYDFMSFAETWLQNHIHDNIVELEGYHLARRDRCNGIHGGVCIYVKDSIDFSILDELWDEKFEVLWVKMCPKRLPRGFNSLVVGTVYHPPSADNSEMLNYLSNCLTSIESQFPNSGLVIVGDFNKLNTSRIQNCFNLKQIVRFSTRGNNTLDLVLTNLSNFYGDPVKIASFGLSDHMSIELRPAERSRIEKVPKITTKTRDLKQSNRLAMRRYLELVNIPEILGKVNSCEGKTSLLETITNFGLDTILPLQSRTVKLNDPPWANPTLKSLIRKRQLALGHGKFALFKQLRNKVNRERKLCRSKYYKESVKHLKYCKPSAWWNEVKKLSGLRATGSNTDVIVKALQSCGTSSITNYDVANEINEAFLLPMANFPALSSNSIHHHEEISESPPVLSVTTDVVFKKLQKLNPNKSHGPDGIPSWLLKENADIFEGPVTDILNCSYQECRLPQSWKMADVVAVPKEKPIKDINNHLRPISLTPIISKLAEEIVIEQYLKPAVLRRIDMKQFGTVPNSCTTYALISMIHSWLESTDGNGATSRVMLLDFKKAFDLVDHQILSDKLTTYDIPNSIRFWILDFLTNRKQRVKLKNDCFSEWLSVPAGVPQGTKLGPWLFVIMINDLNVSGAANLWKYVDDSTMSESVGKDDPSLLQTFVDEFVTKSTRDGLQLKESKCKELRICFSRSEKMFQPVVINDKEVELVSSVKLLGLNITDNLKWNTHIASICKKVSSRLYFLKQLKRAKLPTEDLVLFYTTCIRPVMEYACEVFHDSLPKYLSDDLEKQQKRAFRIILPDLHYQESIEALNINTLYERRQEMTSKLFNKIIEHPEHKLNELLPPLNNADISLRETRNFNLPVCKTLRFKNSFIMSNANKSIR